jgi:L-fuconolactonase
LIRIDAHQHFWRLRRGDYGWLTPAAGVLYRDFEPADLLPELAAAGIAATVLIQAAPTEAETRFLLELAHRHPVIAGVVGWVDFEAPDAPERIRALVRDGRGKLKGLRPMVQDLEDPEWLSRPALDGAFQALVDSDLTFDALVRPRNMPALIRRLQMHPALRSVLDHGGKPQSAPAARSDWSKHIARLARSTPACCKLSGLLTEAPSQVGPIELDLVTATLFEHFGAERIIWGSDWPVVTARASYRRWFDMSRELVRRHAQGREHAVFARNAAQFYKLPLDNSNSKG